MKQTFSKLLVAVMIIAVAGASSCKSGSENKKQKAIDLAEKQAIENQIKENVYPLPTSAEVIKRLKDMDLGFIIGISNPPENAGRYVTSYSRAVNLGIFGTDLSYATLYNLQQEVIDYMEAMRNTTSDLNLSKLFDESLYTSIKDNFDNRDTLVDILTGAFNKSYSYMVENDQANLALLMVGGAWVEGMYITTNVSETGAHLTGFESILLEQKKSFEMFEENARPSAGDEQIARFLECLDPIREVYATLGTSLTMDDIEKLKGAIEKVRSALVE